MKNGVLGNLTILVPFGGSMYENPTFEEVGVDGCYGGS